MSVATASERVERILSVLPWIVEEPGTTVEQVCDRFGMTERDLRADLDLLMYEVGIHPFTPDARVDAIVEDDGRIFVHLGDYFRRPLRLTPDEALVLYAAGRALLDRPDPDPVLARAVDKLSRVLGEGVADAVDVRLGDADPAVLSTVRQAAEDGRRLRIDYYSFGRDERSVREVDPVRVAALGGHWYLTAWCHTAQDVRAFRVDRITTAELTGDPVEAHAGAGEDDQHPDGDLSEGRPVVLVVDAGDEWIVEAFPTTSVSAEGDGRVRVELRVTAEPWLQRLLLRLGSGAEANDATTGEDLRPLAADAAARVLRRYR
ncbi:helix-turn-helix transcriptional regulator [Dermatobacter hominis]|uniref:helix-turn-helix transcriptional regulator n=1 Tax=Dermatobacter hominis TaxID=2884263 RepID=UPI001D102B55|nr:WYL domain-containing protein [Dermatobacter hominis]UDY36386.1 WYL domain-containing protein [Dermatobacter hominis]